MHTTGHCNSLSDLWSRLDMATLFPSHTDFHVVFFTVTAKNKQKTSLRYDIIKRNRVWSDVQTGNNLEPVVCMVSNRCQAPAVSLKYLNYPMVPCESFVVPQGTKSGNLILKGYQCYLTIKETWKSHAVLSFAVHFIYCIVYFQIFF